MVFQELQQQCFSICKDLFIKRVGNITKPIETYRDGRSELQFPLVFVPKNVPIEIYVHVDFYDFKGKLAILTELGFRCGYNKEKWKNNSITGTMLFDCNIDNIYDKVNFLYKGTPQVKAKNGVIYLSCENFSSCIDQFYADVILNLEGPYQYIIYSFN